MPVSESESVQAASPPPDAGEPGCASLRHIIESPQFVRAETLSKLLLYLWEHRGEEISEYAVGTEALGRRADFDPKTDASVRVQISRLRRKLKDFYEAEPAGHAYVLHIPMGSHTLMVLEEPHAPSPAPELPPPPPPPRFSRAVLALGTACSLLAALSVGLAIDLSRTKSAARPVIQPTGFWRDFVTPNLPVKILLPTPVFFSFPKNPNLHIRDIIVNDFQDWRRSEAITSEVLPGGQPALDHSYTVTTDTLAAVELSRYLDRVGLAEHIDFDTSIGSTMNLLEKSSVIAFGAHSTLQPFRDYLASMNFNLAVNESAVTNAHPEPGEFASYTVYNQGDPHSEGPSRLVEPSLIAVLPGRGPNFKLLILQSRRTAALATMLSSTVGDSLFQKMYRAHGSPKFFEMVVMSECEGDHVLRSWPVAMHPYTKNAPSGADVTP